MRKIAVRKIVKIRRTLILLKRIVIANFLFSILGVVLFLTVMPYDVILIDSFLWTLEALLFVGVLMTLYVITSKTLYGARYELLRGESLASLFIALFASILTLYLITNKLSTLYQQGVIHSSSMLSTVYMFSGAVVSLIIWRYCIKFMNMPGISLVITNTLAKKQLLDSLVDAMLGISVVIANVLNKPIIEVLGIVLTSIYVLKGYIELIKEDVIRLLGTHEPIKLKKKIIRIVKLKSGLNVRKVMLTSLGSFYEAEVWVEAPSTMTLIDAYNHALRLAKNVLHEIHEVIRALVILIPSDNNRAVDTNALGSRSSLILHKGGIVNELVNSNIKIKKGREVIN